MARVALLTNFIAPYRLPVLRALAQRVEQLRVFVSTRMEANRDWSPDWAGLDVVVQRNLTVRRTWRHPQGFSESVYMHLPWDTLWQLWRYRPDVVISGEFGLRSLQSACYTRVRRETRLVIWATLSEHHELGRDTLRERARSWMLGRADAVIVNGASGARYIERFGFPRDRIFRIPYTASDGAPPLPKGCQTSGALQHLLYVGQLSDRKGLLPFVDALASWAKRHSDRSLKLKLVGDGPLHDSLAALEMPSNLALELVGPLAHAQLAAVYGEADLLCFPTLADEWGLVVNEAMAHGLPVLGSVYSQAVEELVEPGLTGWTFRPDHGDEMYDAIDQALSASPARLNEMGARARQRVERLTPECAADGFVDVIARVCRATQSLVEEAHA